MKVVPFEVLLLSTVVANAITPPIREPADGFGDRQEVLGYPPSIQHLGADHKYDESIARHGRKYQCFKETGPYPSPQTWLSFEALWKINHESILSQNGGNTYIEHYIKKGILRMAEESQVDARLIIVVLLQQSRGRASIGCTTDSARCGLFQAPHGLESPDGDDLEESILQMIREGVQGVDTGGRHGHRGSSLSRYVGGRDQSDYLLPYNPYVGLAAYEAQVRGEFHDMTDETPSLTRFVDDIANRLVGWNGRGKAKC